MFKILCLATAALLVSGGVIAGDNNSYKNLDTDKDGSISKTEATVFPELQTQWPYLDVNSDGVLDHAEFAKMELKDEQPVSSSRFKFRN